MNQEVIINDIDGHPIHEGDRVWVFPKEYEMTLIDPGGIGGPPIYEEHQDRPRPVKDVPLAKGKVYWSDDMLAYRILLTWLCESWEEGGLASIAMGGGSYAYQLDRS